MFNPNHILIFASLLAALGMWLLLPRGGTRGRSLGAVLAVTALGLGASQMPYLGDWIIQGVFSILAGVTVVAAAAAVSFRKPVYCAIWFGLTLLGVAGLFLLTGAQFLAVATIVVYAGAILVTFLFVLMLANQEGKTIYDRVSWEALISAAAGMVIVGVLSMTIGSVFGAPSAIDARNSSNALTPGPSPKGRGEVLLEPIKQISAPSPEKLAQGVLSPYHVASFGMELFGRHLIAIEIAGMLLLAALVGAAVIVAQKQRGQGSEVRVQDSDPASQKTSGSKLPG